MMTSHYRALGRDAPSISILVVRSLLSGKNIPNLACECNRGACQNISHSIHLLGWATFGKNMEIDFPNTVLPKVTALGTVSFQARVDGEYLWCEISCEALRVHFGAGSMDDDELLRAFYLGRSKIEQVARQCLELNRGASIMLMIGDF